MRSLENAMPITLFDGHFTVNKNTRRYYCNCASYGSIILAFSASFCLLYRIMHLTGFGQMKGEVDCLSERPILHSLTLYSRRLDKRRGRGSAHLM